MKKRATQNFSYGTAQGDTWVFGGDVKDESDPVVLAFPDLFEPLYETVSNPAEPAPQPAPVVRRRRNG